MASPISKTEYETLATFRYALRQFMRFSETAAREAGITPKQHQALLAIKGFPGGGKVTVGNLAHRLRIRHHTAVELVDRLTEGGLVRRAHDPVDHRRVFLELTELADALLAELSSAHLDELSRIEPMLKEVLARRAAR